MIDSTHTPDTETGEAGLGGTIGQALDRIVGEPSRAPVVKKKLDFPRESLRASQFEVNRAILDEPSKAAEGGFEDREEEPEVRVDPAKFQDPDLPYDEVVRRPENKVAGVIAPVEKPAAAPTPAAEPKKENVREEVQEPEITPAPVASPVAAVGEAQDTLGEPLPETDEPKVEKPVEQEVAVEEVAMTPAPKVIVQRKVVGAKPRLARIVEGPREPVAPPVATGAELDLFMRESEKVEERTVKCRPETWAKLQEIAQRTGCSPADLASQAVMGVAAAVREAGFEFSLPLVVECTRRS